MTRPGIARSVAALYPPPVRQRWGDGLVDEIGAGGTSGLLDAVAGALRLWVRPGQWPARTGAHVRRSVVVLAFLVAAVNLLGVRGLAPAIGGNATSRYSEWIWLSVLVVGLCVLAPLPATRLTSLVRCAATVGLSLVPSAVLIAILIVFASSAAPLTGSERMVALVLYWSTLVTIALAPAVAVYRIDPADAVMPNRTRSSIGLALVGVGLFGGGMVNLLFVRPPAMHLFAVTQAVLATLTFAAWLDLRRTYR